mmetsp:Transcript_29254/g.61150  ORF Transcript_29254/g.61150 Transcript_29254/m.61150 type:complete len:84 (+) Transcript_29254:484-735(+)
MEMRSQRMLKSVLLHARSTREAHSPSSAATRATEREASKQAKGAKIVVIIGFVIVVVLKIEIYGCIKMNVCAMRCDVTRVVEC